MLIHYILPVLSAFVGCQQSIAIFVDSLRFLEQFHHPEKYFRIFIKWGILGLIMGLIGGLLGAAFSRTLTFVTALRLSHPWILFLLPAGGLATIGLYRLFKMSGNRGANEIIEAILRNKPVKAAAAPVICSHRRDETGESRKK